ncbi:MAG: U32 family peptidase, partial [candidate division NC10 bacterium]|nr:U32 family peptidase [candidate division NC10 bacterium]
MAGLEFSVPYNNDPETLEEIFELKNLGGNRIREIYLSGPQEYAGSGRITKKLTLKQFLGIVGRIHREGIRVNLVVNATCDGTQWYASRTIQGMLEYMRMLHVEHGVEAVTVANPFYIHLFKARFPHLEITASVLADIDCLQRAAIFRNMGADLITPDANINRDLALLRRIKEGTNAELKLMVNEGCLYKCPFRRFHFNYISHKSRELGEIEGDAFFANCLQVTVTDLSQIL